MPILASAAERAEALKSFNQDIWAASTLRAAKHKMSTITTALAQWDLELLPPDAEKIAALGATLKAGHYKSAPSYLTLYRGHL